MKKRALGIAAALGMLALILDSRTALSGAMEGLDLCLKTVIPSLFPFILLSSLLSDACYGIELPMLSKISGLFHIPSKISYLLIPAFLGGYPVGAQCVHDLYDSGRIHKASAERMLSFCSNAGPSFLFGILPWKFLESSSLWKIWLIQILSAFTIAQFFPVTSILEANTVKRRKTSGNAMELTIKTLGKICGWIILFRIVIVFLDRWFLWRTPSTFKVLLIGLLELSNGCCILDRIGNETIRFIVCNGILAFGGICVLYQTSAVCKGLQIQYYLTGKCLQLLCAVILAVFLSYGLWFLLPIWTVVCIVSNRKEKKSSFSKQTVV